MEKHLQAYVAVTLQSIIIGFSFYFVKIGLQYADPLSLLGHRFTMATLGLFIYYLFKPGGIELQKADWWRILPYILPYPVCFFLLQTLGLQFISSSEAGIINAMTPIFTVILAALFLHERTSRQQKAFMALSVFGMIFISAMSGMNLADESYLGFLFIFLSVLSMAIYNVFVKKALKGYRVMQIVFVMTIVTCVIFNFMALMMHGMNGSLPTYFTPFSHRSFFWAMLYLGIPSSLLTSSLSTYALSQLPAGTVSLFNNVPPVIAIFAGVFFLNESFYWYHFIGIVAILIGVIGFNRIGEKEKG